MFSISNILSISLTLFLVIDILGSVPVILAVKRKSGEINPLTITGFSGILMVAFSLIGEALLHLLGIQVRSFAIAGAVVLLLLALEMILGATIFKSDSEARSGNIVPIAFPILAGVGTLTTIISLRTKFGAYDVLAAIVLNLLIIYSVLRSMNWLEEKLSVSVLNVMKKFFGIILLAMAVQMFTANL